MRTAFLLAALAAWPLSAAMAAPSASAADAPGLSPLAQEYAVKHQDLFERLSKQRRALVQSPAWKSLSPEEREKKLAAFDARARAQDQKLTDEYFAALRRKGDRRTADEEAAWQEYRRRLEEIRVNAAQDALRAKPAP